MLSVHLKVHSVHRAHGVTRVASLTFAHVELRQTAMQVALQLAQTPMRAFWFGSTSDVTTCSDVTSVIVHFKTPLYRRVQALVFRSVVPMQLHIISSNTKCCHPARSNGASFICQLIWRSLSHHLKRCTTSSALLPVHLPNSHPSVWPHSRLPRSILCTLGASLPTLMRFTRDHLQLVSNSEINQTSSGFLGDSG